MRKNKKLLLGGLSVLTLVAAGSGAVSTFAWYQVTSSASVSTAQVTTTLTTHDTTIAAGAYSITLHVYSGASGTSTAFSDVQLSQNEGGSLKKGVYNSTGSATQVAAVTTEYAEFVRQLRVTVEWNVKPSEAAAKNQFKNKKITGAFLLAEGNVKLLAVNNSATVGTDYTKAAVEIYVDDSNDLALSVNSVYAVDPSNNNQIDGNGAEEGTPRVEIIGMRINTNNTSGAEYWQEAEGTNLYGQTTENASEGAVYHSADALGIAQVASLTIGNK